MTPEDFLVKKEKVTACLLSLASNYQADKHLAEVSQQLPLCLPAEMLTFSKIILSSDSNPTTDCAMYHNQMAVIGFRSPLLYTNLHQITKQLEALAHRRDFDKPIVTLDVDIIAIQTKKANWIAIARRLPLAPYEQQGLENLLNNTDNASQYFFRSLLNKPLDNP